MFRFLQISILLSSIIFFLPTILAQSSSRHHSLTDLIIQNSTENSKPGVIDATVITSDTVLFDSFDNMNNWTIVGPLGFSNWHIQNSNFALGSSSPELDIKWVPIFIGDSYILSPVFIGLGGHNLQLTFHDYLTWWADSMIVGVATTTDGGITYNTIWEIIETSTYGPAVETINFIGEENMQLALYYTGNSNNIDDWLIDDLLLTDLTVVPVELTSFTATLNENKVTLNWSTATETNNKGFEIEKTENQTVWEKIAFVEGFGTTTEQRNYSFVDDNLRNGIYNYRLKQIDFDGTASYSSIAEVEINLPTAFALNQNFPNPFNPATNINFSLAVDSKVVIKVFNILGQEVAALLDKKITAGTHNVSFDASGLNSGVYLYKIEAKGIDGTNYSSVKKMILAK